MTKPKTPDQLRAEKERAETQLAYDASSRIISPYQQRQVGKLTKHRFFRGSLTAC